MKVHDYSKDPKLGIDYGLGLSNIDHETGIRYGVINSNAVGQAWYDDSEPYYGPMTCECGEEYPEHDIPDVCKCGEDLSCRDDMGEPFSFTYTEQGYSCEAGEDGDIFVMKSPYYTYAQFCSPCAPGAVHLENPLDIDATVGNIRTFDGNKGYCFGHDWFEDDKAPYKVYDVKTGKEVLSGP